MASIYGKIDLLHNRYGRSPMFKTVLNFFKKYDSDYIPRLHDSALQKKGYYRITFMPTLDKPAALSNKKPRSHRKRDQE